MPEKEQAKETITVDLDNTNLFVNRELSLLEFQQRVLDEAEDENNLLLERLKFLSIVSSNLDEFFMVRVAGLKKQIEANIHNPSFDGMSPTDTLAAIRKVTDQLMAQQRTCWRDRILPKLKDAGILVLNYPQLNQRQKETLTKYFNDVVFPVVTPLGFDPGHPFPHISNLSLNLAVIIRDKVGKEHFARLKVPNTLPRLVPLKRSSGSIRKDGTIPFKHYFVWLEQVIAAHLNSFFPGMKVVESHPFRITRDADMIIQELEASDLLETMELSVRQRRFGSVVRMGINPEMPERIREILVENLEINRNDVYVLDGPLGLSDLMSLYQSIDRFDLKETPFKPAIQNVLLHADTDRGIFEMIRQGDILVHHPYDSFSPVVDFLKTAANDPDVLTIKQTLYRVGKKPPVVEALLEAAQNGKQVAVLVELKARFDEESNIGWAKMLEKEGVHVIYGLLGLKTHSKVAMVVRREGEGIRRYIHLATGNYNAVTAQLYEDIGMFTCDEEIGADVTDLFNFLTGYSSKQDYRKLLVAPINLRTRMEALIERETKIAAKGNKAHLIFKVNSLVDKSMIKMLYKASQAGVKIDLLVRGMCCLKPGIEGVSENIKVISIVGRFLEHSRIFYFLNGGKEEIFLGSADLMPRNIDWRVEVLFPVCEERIIQQIYQNILSIYLKDNVKARRMKNDGTYQRLKPDAGQPALNSQAYFLDQRRSP
jgi:polyphosphate kinase